MTQIFARPESGRGDSDAQRRCSRRCGFPLILNLNLILIPPALCTVATAIKNRIKNKNKNKIPNHRMRKLAEHSCIIANSEARA